MVTRAEYVEALKREQGFVKGTTPDDAQRLSDLEAELAQFDGSPAKRGRPETA